MSASLRSKAGSAASHPPQSDKGSSSLQQQTQQSRPFSRVCNDASATDAAAAATPDAAAPSKSRDSDESARSKSGRHCSVKRQSTARPAARSQASQAGNKRAAASPDAKVKLESAMASPAVKAATAPAASAASSTCWPIPQLEELRTSLENTAMLSRHPFDEQIKPSKKARSSSRPPQRQQEKWLLLACADMLQKLDIIRGDETLLSLSSPLEIVTTLLEGKATDITAREETHGFTVLHLLVLSALSQPIGLARYKRDSSQQGIELTKVLRYASTEPILNVLLQASKAAGFCGDHRANEEPLVKDEEDEEEQAPPPSMLDCADKERRTPLDWAINHRRPDVVALLLLHGASVNQDEWRKLQWDPRQTVKREQTAASRSRSRSKSKSKSRKKGSKLASDKSPKGSSASSTASSQPSQSLVDQVQIHPLVATIDPTVYCDANFHDARKYGNFFHDRDAEGQPTVRGEGWCIESIRRKGFGESKEAACKRLLFQHALLQATEADPFGNADDVHRLVELWLADEATSAMHPLCYRADGFWFSPLQIAVAYDREAGEFDNRILFDLLRLPHSFHIQSASKEWTALTKAILADNREAASMLLKAGYNIDQRDVANGRTAFFNAAVELLETHELEAVKSLLRFLVDEHGADMTLADDCENTIVHLVAFLGHMPSLIRFMTSRLGQEAMESLVQRVNSAGNTAMHIALANAFEEGESGRTDLEIARQISAVSIQVDGPVNLAGHTPLQLFAGRASDVHVPELAKLLQLPEQTLLDQRHPTHKLAGPLQLVCNTGAEGNGPVELWSCYEHDLAELQSTWFRYITQHRPTDWPSHHFVNQPMLLPQVHVEGQPTHEADRFRVPFQALQVRFVEGKGWGLFAIADIAPTQYLEVIGELLSASARDAREREYLQRGHLALLPAFRVQNEMHEFFIDQTRYGNLTRYINHSCSPNLKVWTSNNKRRVMLWPIDENRGIKAGTELTINYELLDELAKTPVPRCIVFCRCGEDNCTRTII